MDSSRLAYLQVDVRSIDVWVERGGASDSNAAALQAQAARGAPHSRGDWAARPPAEALGAASGENGRLTSLR